MYSFSLEFPVALLTSYNLGEEKKKKGLD